MQDLFRQTDAATAAGHVLAAAGGGSIAQPVGGRISVNWMEKARQFHQENPDVYRQFEALAFEAMAAGLKHYSADAIMHVVRFKSDVRGRGRRKFKINNNYVAFYTRLFDEVHPQHADLFAKRSSQQHGG